MFRVYFSNIRSQWPIERQEKAIAEVLPDWRDYPTYIDEISQAQRRRQRPLPERDTNLLRAVGRTQADGTRVIIASMPVIAWTPPDFMAVLIKLAGRHEMLQTVAEDIVIDPVNANMDELQKVFRQAARRFSYKGITGGEASGQLRHARVLEQVEKARPFWPSRDPQYSTNKLAKMFGISRPSLTRNLPDRDEARQKHEHAVKVAEANRKRRKSEPEK